MRGAGGHRGLLLRLDGCQLVLRHFGLLHDLAVDDQDSAFSDRAHSQLRLEWHAEPAHHDDIQRRAKRLRHLKGDGDSSPRQTQHDDRLTSQVTKPGGKLPACIFTISENHD